MTVSIEPVWTAEDLLSSLSRIPSLSRGLNMAAWRASLPIRWSRAPACLS